MVTVVDLAALAFDVFARCDASGAADDGDKIQMPRTPQGAETALRTVEGDPLDPLFEKQSASTKNSAAGGNNRTGDDDVITRERHGYGRRETSPYRDGDWATLENLRQPINYLVPSTVCHWF